MADPEEKGDGIHSRRRRRSRADATGALIEAAAALFAERPSGRVTMREIAERAGVNHGLVHRYFGTKQNLMRAALEQSHTADAIGQSSAAAYQAGRDWRAAHASQLVPVPSDEPIVRPSQCIEPAE